MEHTEAAPAYGLWGLVIINSVIFVAFAFSFFKPQIKTDWRTFSAFSAFLIALFAEMYGLPMRRCGRRKRWRLWVSRLFFDLIYAYPRLRM